MRRIQGTELQQIQLGLLDELMRVCKEIGVTPFLSGGTMLGAVRHKGFIPWDDDVDIMLFREDYEKLLASFPNHDHFELRSYHTTPDYPFLYASLCDTRTIKIERNLRRRYTELLGVNLDLFPIDSIPEDDGIATECFRNVARFDSVLKCATYRFGSGKGVWGSIRKNIGIFLCRVVECFGIRIQRRILSRWDRFCSSRAEKSSHVAIMTIDHYGTKEINLAADYFPPVMTLFEGRLCPAPRETMRYLHNLYGEDCLELPPPEKRVTHHESDCYWKDGFESTVIEKQPCAER